MIDENEDEILVSRICLDNENDNDLNNINLKKIIAYYENEEYRYTSVNIDELSLDELKELRENISGDIKTH